jgi:hypothetical protein
MAWASIIRGKIGEENIRIPKNSPLFLLLSITELFEKSF